MIAFEVNDMTCGHCAGAVTRAVKQVDAAAQVSVDLAAKRVGIQSSAAASALQTAIEEAGYSARPVAAAPCVASPRVSCCGCGR